MSRPSAAGRTESRNSDPYWKAGEFAALRKTSERLRREGDYAALETLYRQGVDKAREAENPRAEIDYWTSLGNTYIFLYRYEDAIDAYEQAREMAKTIGDWPAAAAVAPGLSSVHYFVGDLSSARNAIQEGLDAIRRVGTHPYEAQLKLQDARLNSGRDSISMIMAARDAVEAVRADANNAALEPEAWDLMGEGYLHLGQLEAAENAFSEAYRFRLLQKPKELHLSYWRLGSLRLAQERWEEAALFTDKAIQASSKAGMSLFHEILLHQRGIIRQAQGREDLALRDFEEAVAVAAQWRTIVPSSQSARTAADAELDRRVFRSFINAAAHRGLRDRGGEWASKAFFAVERNRAYSLQPLPLSRSGIRHSPNKLEIFPNGDTLSRFQRGLRESELVLSFYTDTGESYLWAVTRDSLHLYPLSGADRIGKAVEKFQADLIHHGPETSSLGAELYQTLFGQLTPAEAGKANWVLSLDGPLFELPFGALRERNTYLIESHSLQVTPGAGFLKKHEFWTTGPKGFLGIGDAIYNSADTRVRPSGSPALAAGGQLNRLVASEREISRSAEPWSGAAKLLRGETATRREFLESLATRPAAIHLATHVVEDAASKDGTPQASIAFSIGKQGWPELLSTPEVAGLDVKGALVVMTGCSSGTGEVRPGAGLLGLTRAWMTAGADAVLATGWPVEDTAGDLLPVFYKQLGSLSAAEALRRSQMQMIHSGTWQADPAYWAAFRLTGGAR